MKAMDLDHAQLLSNIPVVVKQQFLTIYNQSSVSPHQPTPLLYSDGGSCLVGGEKVKFFYHFDH